jgi:hypothetical protein
VVSDMGLQKICLVVNTRMLGNFTPRNLSWGLPRKKAQSINPTECASYIEGTFQCSPLMNIYISTFSSVVGYLFKESINKYVRNSQSVLEDKPNLTL